ncbi:MAG: hypothetical protein RJQ09_02985 [Cyclobacteriaceae bacterium]
MHEKLHYYLKKLSFYSEVYLGFFLRKTQKPYILFLKSNPYYNNDYLEWVKRKYPEVYCHFKIGLLRPFKATLQGVGVLVNWANDSYRNDAQILEDIHVAADKLGIPIINSQRVLGKLNKLEFSEVALKNGVRTPKMIRINSDQSYDQIECALSSKFIVRCNMGNGVHSYRQLVTSQKDLWLVEWESMQDPIAIEFIDTIDDNGYYNVYRHFFVGSKGILNYVSFSNKWCLHWHERDWSQERLQKELEILNEPVKFQSQLNDLREDLKLDYVNFDYSVDMDGNIVVWEINTRPWIDFDDDSEREGNPAIYARIEETFLEMTRLYLSKANIYLLI